MENRLGLQITNHDFEVAKEQLKKFAEQDTENLKFEKVRTHEKIFDLEFSEHGVTGTEFNKLIEQIQNYFANFYDRQQDLIKEFGQVYQALEILDKDYIQAILSTVKAIEKTNQNIQIEQKRLDNSIKRQESTLQVLKKFKDDINDFNSKINTNESINLIKQVETQVKQLEKSVILNNEYKVSKDNQIFKLQLELTNTHQQFQNVSNKLTTVFILLGFTIATLIFILFFSLLR
ncbi:MULTISPECIES: hypothetical protein [Streptococcus]|jgi:hypothetical protein|uniref:hypothetical protein n=1 Tax=Streptococcus TaxID=1301 RepID=UPI000F2AF30C|nr:MULTISPECIES: hypothetical protein [Streptococcus]MBF1702664.1 hypothetical protein [Streptococcus sanguinis]MCY7022558.1 hypothetical protein [Streptococcus sanguinis]MDN5012559.1 hypothetical protein [Streptococcus sp. SN3]RKW01033.1 MAG: hypothetical protein D8H99_16540 [Streptococcus sp.]